MTSMMLAFLAAIILGEFVPYPHEHCDWRRCCDEIHTVQSGVVRSTAQYSAEGTQIGDLTLYFMNPLGQEGELPKIRVDGMPQQCTGLQVCEGCAKMRTTECKDLNDTATDLEIVCIKDTGPHTKHVPTAAIAVSAAVAVGLCLAVWRAH